MTNDKASRYPSLHAYMLDLYRAGMSVEEVLSRGYLFAESLVRELAQKEHRFLLDGTKQMEEVAMVLCIVSIELGISLDQQRVTQ